MTQYEPTYTCAGEGSNFRLNAKKEPLGSFFA